MPLLDAMASDVQLCCSSCGAKHVCCFLSGLKLFKQRATYSSAGGWSSSSSSSSIVEALSEAADHLLEVQVGSAAATMRLCGSSSNAVVWSSAELLTQVRVGVQQQDVTGSNSAGLCCVVAHFKQRATYSSARGCSTSSRDVTSNNSARLSGVMVSFRKNRREPPTQVQVGAAAAAAMLKEYNLGCTEA
jgi:hypothetical protein